MPAPLRALAALMGVVTLALFAGAAVAQADGDPASDTLLGEPVFYPYQPAVSQPLQNQLNAEATAASRAGFPLKVAIIGSPIDLGTIPELFGKPQPYASFLDQEISYQHAQPLLVVMKTGYGVKGVSAAVSHAVTSLPKPASGNSNDLTRAALTAVRKLAAASGHPLGASGGPKKASSPVLLIVLIAAAVVVATALVVLRARVGGRR